MNENNVENFIKEAIKKYFDKHMVLDGMFWKEAIGLFRNKVKQSLLSEIKNFKNPYPKDIFKWDNKEKLKFNRGRFNKHCFEIVENMRKKLLEDLEVDVNAEK